MGNNSKKIAFFISSLRAGGGEKMMVDLANAFAKDGASIDLVVMKSEGALGAQIDKKVNLVDLKVGRILGAIPKLVEYIKKEKPEAIMALDEYSHLILLFAAKRSGEKVRVVLRIGNMFEELFKRYTRLRDRFIIPFLIKRYYKRADIIIAVSEGVADSIQKITGVEKQKIMVIYNPKDLENIYALSGEPTGHAWIDKKTLPVILCVGRLREQKNFAFLLGVFKEVVKKVPSKLIILGVGREEMKLRDLVRSSGLEASVSLPGYFGNPYMFMAKADMFVSASLWEGMPNSLIEAMITGLPIIASDCDSGPREVLAPSTPHNFRLKEGVEYAKNGILCARNDKEAFMAAILKLLTDNNVKKQYIEASKIRSIDFDMKQGLLGYKKALGL